jgi:short-subunit dehydrogenase
MTTMTKEIFKDKVVIITGARQGIGKTLAFMLGNLGAKLIINDCKADGLERTKNELLGEGFKVLSVEGDVSKSEVCQTLITSTIDYFGKIDILINNAGMAAKGSVEETDPDVFKTLVDVNILGSVYPTKYVLPYIKETKGSIIFISSLAGINGLPYNSAYSASKMALTALAESLKIELYKTKVHVGIAYLSFTENDPNKEMFNPEGKLVAVPKRSNYKVMPVTKTASVILQQIEKRKFKVIHSSLGKMNWFLNKVAPRLVEIIKIKSITKFQY